MADLTRAAVEGELCDLYGRLMDLVGLFGGVRDGTNPSLNAPIRDALRDMGYAVLDPVAVADVDLAPVPGGAVRRLLEHAGVYVLEQVDRDWWRAEQSPRPGLTPEILARAYARMSAALAGLREAVLVPFTPFVTTVALGRIAAGSTLDPTVPLSLQDVVPPCLVQPRYYGAGYPFGPWPWGECL